ncbi:MULTISPECIES: DsbA family oxidoreductase [unclassified Agarivorans]|uniref:DsbA family oxidoreductase n=1 Tax=unclassified Agarivorans TaxID=2636026 RepID=UPI003D7C43A4
MPAITDLRIDIVSDVVCPWCIVGYLRLQQALAKLDSKLNVQLHWQPFELNPHLPAEGQNLREHIQQKYGSSVEQSETARQQLKQIGSDLGFDFNFNSDSRIYNTFEAHQLLHWAATYQKQTELKLALFEAYFSQQLAPSDRENLLAVVAKVGLDSSLAEQVLNEKLYAEEVREKEYSWQNQGIKAVPAFIFNQRFLLSGAQNSDTLIQVIEQSLQD